MINYKLPKTIHKFINISSYFIHVDSKSTPNPNFLKFIPTGYKVLQQEGTLDISSRQYATISPLAQQLFQVKGITRIFYASDYLSVAKDNESDWSQLKPKIYQIISNFFQSKKPLLTNEVSLDDKQIDGNDSQTVQFIKEVLASRIRPTVQQDGGDVKFVQFDQKNGRLTLKMVGACSSCPSSSITLKNGIQKMLLHYISEVKEVIAE